MKVSSKTNLMGGHGNGCLRLGKEVCLCGKPAIKWKLSGWVCDRCNRIEERQREDGLRKECSARNKSRSGIHDIIYKCSLKLS